MHSRRHILKLLAAGGLASAAPATAQATLPLSQAVDLAHRAGVLHDLHALVIAQPGQPVFSRYFEGEDQVWGRPIGPLTFTHNTLHDLRSVSKSITSLLYGIALDLGLVGPPDSSIWPAFPEHADLVADPARAGWQIAHALNMTLGTEWNEALPYFDPKNAEIQMENAPDRFRFILERPVSHPPGTRWNYSGGCTALLGEIVARGAGMPLEEFAQRHLFGPLGIMCEWTRGRDGTVAAASGLRLTAPGLLRIGQMLLVGGQWQGKQIVPRDWVTACQTAQLTTTYGSQYSNQWYQSVQYAPYTGTPVPLWFAAGNGGQRIYLLPEQDTVIVIYAGSYNWRDDWMTPTLILQRIVLPHLIGR